MSPQDSPDGVAIIKAQFAENIVQNTDMSWNLGGSIITTTEDKVRLAVITHLARIGERHGWIAPLGIFVPVVATLVTTDFRSVLLPAPVWQALFLLTAAISLGWLLLAAYHAFKAPTVDDFVAQLKAKQLPAAAKPGAKP